MTAFLASLTNLDSPLPVPFRAATAGAGAELVIDGLFLPDELAELEPDEYETFHTPKLIDGIWKPAGAVCGWRLTRKGRARAEAAQIE